ncbi:3-methyl-2-oxobutanoate hydroxymethyltransferase [archaeon]|nr:MAG: 3-methyl-2-oxobutanoate hydroxymethyltransferase [archaeon]
MTMEDMLHHCKAVRRGAPSRFIVGDMPFGSYEQSVEQGLHNAFRLVKEAGKSADEHTYTLMHMHMYIRTICLCFYTYARIQTRTHTHTHTYTYTHSYATSQGMDAVKIEGSSPYKVKLVQRLVDSGISVMGHVGLTPQSISVLGGFRAQGRTAVKARQLIDEALQLQRAGVFSCVIECVPSAVAQAITGALQIPTIGIGAGGECSGQVLVYHDLLGVMHHPHHALHVPKFCKQYASLGQEIHTALLQYKEEVRGGIFPSPIYSPYKMSEEEEIKFKQLLLKDAQDREAKAREIDQKLKDADEYEAIKLY